MLPCGAEEAIMARTITGLTVRDIRTPTSRTLAGSDAVHTDPDYSATYVVLTTDARDGIEGHGMTFTLGRGNEVVVAAVRALQHLIVGSKYEDIVANLGGFWKRLTFESQLRWIGPEKGAIHLATAAIVNAVWDLYAKVERKPVWKLVADMTPEQFVSCIDFRYLTDALTRDDALEILRAQIRDARRARSADAQRGLPGLHHVRRMDGISRRESSPPLPRGARRGMDPVQNKSRARLGRQRSSRGDRARRNRTARHHDDGCEPGVGRRRGDRVDAPARALQSVVDRRADQPR